MKNMKSKSIGISLIAVLAASAGATASEYQTLEASRAEVRSVIASELTSSNHRQAEYVWGRGNKAEAPQAEKSSQANFKWASVAAPESAVAGVSGDSSRAYATRSSATQQGFKWGIRSTADQQGFKWGIRSTADQQGFKWGIRSTADQQGFKWGIRSTVDQQGFKWGIRSTADQQGFKWGIRSTADQQGFKWGIRGAADQQGFKWGIRSTADLQGFKWGIR